MKCIIKLVYEIEARDMNEAKEKLTNLIGEMPVLYANEIEEEEEFFFHKIKK